MNLKITTTEKATQHCYGANIESFDAVMERYWEKAFSIAEVVAACLVPGMAQVLLVLTQPDQQGLKFQFS